MSGTGLPHAVGSRAETLLALVPAFRDWLLLRSAMKQAAASTRIVTRLLWAAPEPATSGGVTACLSALRAEGRSVKTLHNVRSALANWFDFLQERGALAAGAGNPARQVRLAPLPRRMPRYLDPQEIGRALEAAQTAGCWAEVLLALCTGLRLGELTRLQWADVDLAGRRLFVRQAKNGQPRPEPLCPTAAAALDAQRSKLAALGCGEFLQVFPARKTWPGGWGYRDKPRCPKTWRTILEPVRAAVPKFTQAVGTGRAWHLFRHTFGSRLAQANVSDRRIARLLGHSDVRTVDVYAHLAEGYDPAVELASPILGAPRASKPSQPSNLSRPEEEWDPTTD
jgi:integrase